MAWPLLATLLALGLGGGFLSGAPRSRRRDLHDSAVAVRPALLGVGLLTMKEVAAVSMVQVLSASLTGVLAHNKNRFVSKRLLLVMGVMNAVGNLAGSLYSKNTKSSFLLAIFASLAVIAAVVMFIPRREQGADVAPEDVQFNRPLRPRSAWPSAASAAWSGRPGRSSTSR